MLFFGDEFGDRDAVPLLRRLAGRPARCGARRTPARVRPHGAPGRRAIELPDPCDAATFEASRPGPGAAHSADGRRALERVRAALAVRRAHIAPRQHLLLTGQHTAQRVADTGLRVCWRYQDGHAVAAGTEPRSAAAARRPSSSRLDDAQELLRHAWPEGTDRGHLAGLGRALDAWAATAMNDERPSRPARRWPQRCGVALRYSSFWGEDLTVPEAVLRQALSAMGVVPEKRTRETPAAQPADLPPVHVVTEGQPVALRWPAAADAAARSDGRRRATRTAGASRCASGTAAPRWRRACDRAAGRSRSAATGGCAPGGVPSTTTACWWSRPQRCWVPRPCRRASAGGAAPSSCTRCARPATGASATSATCAGWCETAARHGASFIGLSPLHALFPHRPEAASPYSPSSRNALNPIYLDVQSLVDLSGCRAGPRSRAFRSLPGAPAAAARRPSWSTTPGVAAVKEEVAVAAVAALRARGARGAARSRGEHFSAFVRAAPRHPRAPRAVRGAAGPSVCRRPAGLGLAGVAAGLPRPGWRRRCRPSRASMPPRCNFASGCSGWPSCSSNRPALCAHPRHGPGPVLRPGGRRQRRRRRDLGPARAVCAGHACRRAARSAQRPGPGLGPAAAESGGA